MSRTYPVVEVFGPTVQGEGPAQGGRCWFVRLGGCDYRCSWCDSMYAVLPSEVAKAQKLTPFQVCAELLALGMGPHDMLVLSGGNPALHHLDPLLDALGAGVRLHVETQGTVFREWLNRCELVVVSPKPPSSGMDVERGLHAAKRFCARLTVPWVLKFVAFNDADLDWAIGAREEILRVAPLGHHEGSYLSAGTPQENVNGAFPDALLNDVLRSYRWLANEHVARPALGDFKIGLQAHVLAWPGEMGK